MLFLPKNTPIDLYNRGCHLSRRSSSLLGRRSGPSGTAGSCPEVSGYWNGTDAAPNIFGQVLLEHPLRTWYNHSHVIHIGPRACAHNAHSSWGWPRCPRTVRRRIQIDSSLGDLSKRENDNMIRGHVLTKADTYIHLLMWALSHVAHIVCDYYLFKVWMELLYCHHLRYYNMCFLVIMNRRAIINILSWTTPILVIALRDYGAKAGLSINGPIKYTVCWLNINRELT